MTPLRRSALVAFVALAWTWSGLGRGDEPAIKRVPFGKAVLEVEGDSRRVVVPSVVCLREGQLEGLLTRKNLKEHEYVVATEADARDVHAALLLAKGKPGAPVQFAPKYVPAHGSAIKVSLRYTKGDKTVTVPASEWIREVKGKKALAEDWVFAGSRFVPDPDGGKKPIYLANYGDLICVCNMDTAMLDLPVKSTKALADRLFEANTDKIPERDTKVDVILEVRPDPKK